MGAPVGFNQHAGVCFVVLNAACVFYVLSFSSNNWIRQDPPITSPNDPDRYTQYGLWETCLCTPSKEVKDAVPTAGPLAKDLGKFDYIYCKTFFSNDFDKFEKNI